MHLWVWTGTACARDSFAMLVVRELSVSSCVLIGLDGETKCPALRRDSRGRGGAVSGDYGSVCRPIPWPELQTRRERAMLIVGVASDRYLTSFLTSQAGVRDCQYRPGIGR